MEGLWYVTVDENDPVPVSSWEDVVDLVTRVRSRDNEFFVLEREPESQSFIQAAIWNNGLLRDTFVMEVRIPQGGSFRHLRMKVKGFDPVLDAVRRFVDEQPPVGKWDDVTDELAYLAEDVVMPGERPVDPLDVDVLQLHRVERRGVW